MPQPSTVLRPTAGHLAAAAVVALSAAPAEAAVRARITLDRDVVEWRQEHTLNLLIDFVRVDEAAEPSSAQPEPTPVRAQEVSLELTPAPILRGVQAPGFPPLRRGVHTALYAGATRALLLRLRIAPASTGTYRLGTLRLLFEDPDTGAARRVDHELTVRMQIDEATARDGYGEDLAATDLDAPPARNPAAPGDALAPGEADGIAAAMRIPAPEPRVTAASERILAAFATGRRRPGNPADEASLTTCLRRRPFSVLLDPGHAPTGETRGRAGRKATEALYNDRIAAALERRLRHHLGLTVALTRRGAEPLPIAERIEKAEELDADLVLSLHHDNVSPRRQQLRRVDGVSVRTCNEYQGFSVYVRTDGAAAADSQAAARFVANELLAHGRPIGRFFEWGDPHYGVYDGSVLHLLNGLERPALLLELGYPCNPQERAMLDRDRFVENEARMLTHAIRRYVLNRHCAP